ncbi:MAG TPA: tetratricopeptide repeat protein [Candidatus Acidoferrales bacterium]|nr:tetratricopeptide repeat protein [Candidatus Acidoferrales bacterium]
MKKKTAIHFTIVAAFLLAAALLSGLINGPVAAQTKGAGSIAGVVKGTDGNPWAGVTVSVEPDGGGAAERTATTDANGKYKLADLPAAMYVITIKEKDETIFQIKARVAANSETPADINFKDPTVAAQMNKFKSEHAAANKFTQLKQHFDAGNTALTQAQTLRTQWTKAPSAEKAGIQAQIDPVSATAVSEFQQALAATAETDANNRASIMIKLGESYEADGKYEDATKNYEQAVTIKPDAGVYNNLGNDYAKINKIDEAKAAYAKSVELDPANAKNAYLNSGITLYNTSHFKDAIEPLKKVTDLDPKNAEAWYLLGASLAGTMDSKQEGDKITFTLQPGTLEAYQKAAELDPNGTWGKQAEEGLEQLKALGLGINTKEKVAKPVKH